MSSAALEIVFDERDRSAMFIDVPAHRSCAGVWVQLPTFLPAESHLYDGDQVHGIYSERSTYGIDSAGYRPCLSMMEASSKAQTNPCLPPFSAARLFNEYSTEPLVHEELGARHYEGQNKACVFSVLVVKLDYSRLLLPFNTDIRYQQHKGLGSKKEEHIPPSRPAQSRREIKKTKVEYENTERWRFREVPGISPAAHSTGSESHSAQYKRHSRTSTELHSAALSSFKGFDEYIERSSLSITPNANKSQEAPIVARGRAIWVCIGQPASDRSRSLVGFALQWEKGRVSWIVVTNRSRVGTRGGDSEECREEEIGESRSVARPPNEVTDTVRGIETTEEFTPFTSRAEDRARVRGMKRKTVTTVPWLAERTTPRKSTETRG
ncbi:hypothetical protein DFP72DRAFT_1039429 [Ephemerocybe angulata]|uniref:Uncharacterized protein n=1 Tax=Ephemerocybe angulata TaxID=980116 RepID=A0A8H6IH78_9AGAR|nr:hypothetical protein DFP72DRAFT_1039429 [Tulosesus angulatus]